ncbi:MAG: GGDEF domain-containing protein [Candidatus Nanopelagicales bacterium]
MKLFRRRVPQHVDPLTGTWNQRVLAQPTNELLQARAVEPCTVAFVNLLGFIRYNDQHGHDAGDALLREIAQIWLSSLPEHGAVIRLGSNFAMVLPGFDRDAAEALSQTLLARSPHRWSCGFAAWAGETSLHDVVTAADDDALRRKIEGKH